MPKLILHIREKMEIKEALRSLFQEMILPEFDQIKNEQQKLVEKITSVDKRLDDITAHLIDQSRRIGDINKRIDRLYEVIVRRDEHIGLESKVENLGRESKR